MKMNPSKAKKENLEYNRESSNPHPDSFNTDLRDRGVNSVWERAR
jgi:hypothetical protein